MSNHLSRVVSLVAAAIATAALAAPAAAKVKVVATVPDLAALVAEVGGKQVEVTAMSLATQDPHFVDAKPSLIVKLNKADLLVAVGLDLEVGWLPKLQTSARNGKILTSGSGFLDCSTAVRVLDVPTTKVDRSMGDVHPQGNPHYLYDPRAAAKCAQAIAAKLGAIDSGNAKTYAANAAAFVARLDKARAGWEARMKPYRGTKIITYHKSWDYLNDWLGLVELDTLEPKPGVPPSPGHVADVLKAGRAAGAKVVIQESYYPDKVGGLVAKKLGGAAVTLPGGTDIGGGERYLDHVERVVTALEAALK